MAQYPQLARSALLLRNAAPREFAELIRELDTICHDLRTALVKADPSAILIVQGRAQQADDLLAAFDPPQTKTPSTTTGHR